MTQWLGLDIGGANLKAGFANGKARSIPFPLWKHPEKLTGAIESLMAPLPPADAIALTMTGELCDCFATKADGVRHILASVQHVAKGRPVQVWSIHGQWLTPEQTAERPLDVAAANWLALATAVGKSFPMTGPCLLVDLGSTTCDLIPLQDGIPVPKGRTDPERMRSGELVYTGCRRTPLCALLGSQVAAEWFATTLDVYLALGLLADEPDNRDTADGRPATRRDALRRLAHQVCGDLETIPEAALMKLAQQARDAQKLLIETEIGRLVSRFAGSQTPVILAGSGEVVAKHCLGSRPSVLSLCSHWGSMASEAACAVALAKLASM